LLAHLLLNRHPSLTRQHLAFLFWPDSTEKQAYTNLRKAILALRRALPDADDCLHINKQTIGWRQELSCTLDVTEFEDALTEAAQSSLADQKRDWLERAVTGYRGDLLPGFYDDWLVETRERLRQQYAGALVALIELLEDARDYTAAIQYAQTLLRHDPLHETAYRRLMRLHALSGNRAAALRTYHTCVTILQRELGVPPGAAMRELHDQLVKSDDTSSQPVQPVIIAPAVLPLVGRQQEWRKLQLLWRAATKGRPSFVLINGEAGIGKTRLAEELLTWADRQGMTTVGARCFLAEGELPYAPIVEWLRAVPLQKRFTDVDDTWLREAARLLPELQIQRPDLPPPTPVTEGWQRHHLFTALAHVVLGGNQPCLLLLDDAQWADRETLEWVSFLFRFAPQGRFLILVTIRSEEVMSQHRFTAFKRQWQQMGYLVELPLSPLTLAETATLAENITNTKLAIQQTSQLHRQTEGNPLFIVETLRSASPSLTSPKIQAVIESRLAQLSPSSRRLLDVAAVMGRSFEFELWRLAGNVDEETAINALDELWQRCIIREQGDGYDFCHPLVREITHQALSVSRRRHLHLKVAAALETVFAHNLATVSGELAVHYKAGRKTAKAAAYFVRAFETAQTMYATHEALAYAAQGIELLEKLIADTPPGFHNRQHSRQLLTILEKRGLTLTLLHDMATYVQDNERIRALAIQLNDTWMLGVHAHREALTLYSRGSYNQALAAAQWALSRSWQRDDPVFKGRCQRLIGRIARSQGDFALAEQSLQSAILLFRTGGDVGYEILAYSNLSTVHYLKGEYATALAIAKDALARCDTGGAKPHSRRLPLGDMGVAATALGDFDAAEKWLQTSLDIARDISDHTQEVICAGELGRLHLRRQQPAQADVQLQSAYQVAAKIDLHPHQSQLLRGLAEARLMTGRHGDARRYARQALTIAQKQQLPFEIKASQQLLADIPL